jgi:sporulation protein YlmC with PRC-barrel domain
MSGKRACVRLGAFLMVGATALPLAATHADPDGKMEANAAFEYTLKAAASSNVIDAHAALQDVINCLTGPGDPAYKANSGDRCAGHGKGAIVDNADASARQQLRLAADEASQGLGQTTLLGAQTNAGAILQYLQSAGVNGPVTQTAPAPPPSEAVITLTPQEIEASRLSGATITGADGTVIGTITDLVVATEPHAVRIVGLRLAKDDREIAIPWFDLGLSATAGADTLRSALNRDQIAAAPAFATQQHARPFSIDAGHDLIGRPVTAAGGGSAGTVADLVIDRESGTIDHVLVKDTQAPPGDGQLHALDWSAITDLKAQQSIVIALDQAQIAAAPRFQPR